MVHEVSLIPFNGDSSLARIASAPSRPHRTLALIVALSLIVLNVDVTASAQMGGFGPHHDGLSHTSMDGSLLPSAGEKVTKALAKPATPTDEARPLEDLVAVFKESTGIRVMFDKRAMAEQNIPTDVEVTGEIQGLSWGDAFDLLLPDVGLDFVLAGDIVRITTAEKMQSAYSVQTFEVNELLEGPGGEPGPFTQETLFHLLQSSIPSGDWKDNDEGGGAMVLVDGVLIVTQHRRGQSAIARTLAHLNTARQARKSRVAGDPMPVVAYRIYCPDVLQSDDGTYPAFFSIMARWIYPLGGFVGTVKPAEQGGAPNRENAVAPQEPDALLTAISGADRSKSFADDLAKLLPTLVAPETWRADGGGSVHGIPGVLIVKQTPVVHRQIRLLLRPFLKPAKDASKPNNINGGFGGGIGAGGGLF